ncbi:MAG: hypothetical protein SVU88_03085 [Candidatus Nanohaloarchaea archaeon]|nr:hypothetical protein [Candidatus Nanohaloarchaea archaeon]
MDVDVQMSDTERRRYLLGGAVAAAAVLIGAFVLMGGPSALQPAGQQGQDGGQDEFEQYADASEETGTRNIGDAEIAQTITINEFGTTPARAEIDTGQAVKWVNQNSYPVYITFDRTSQEPSIGPGEELTMRFRGVTYYKVFNANTDERVARGSISVG